MKRILFVLSNLEYGSAATTWNLVATGLKDSYQIRSLSLVAGGPLADKAIEPLGWHRPLDWSPFRRLREVVTTYQPDVIHAIGLSALRALTLTCRPFTGQLVASSLGRPPRTVSLWRPCDRWALARVDQVIFRGQWEAKPWQARGLATNKCAIIPPGVAVPAVGNDAIADWRRRMHFAESQRVITCIGPMQPDKGLRDAIWTLDILHYLIDTLCLVLIGDGVDRPRLQSFARAIKSKGPIQFAGELPEVFTALYASELVWVPSTAPRGMQVVLEAQAAGRAVIATQWPCFEGLIEHGVTGFLTPPGDKPALARQTRLVLEDAALRKRVGEAARAQAAEQFSAERMVNQLGKLYL